MQKGASPIAFEVTASLLGGTTECSSYKHSFSKEIKKSCLTKTSNQGSKTKAIKNYIWKGTLISMICVLNHTNSIRIIMKTCQVSFMHFAFMLMYSLHVYEAFWNKQTLKIDNENWLSFHNCTLIFRIFPCVIKNLF